MTKNIFTAIAIVFLLTSCKSKKAAFEYSEKIVAMEKSLEPAIKSTESKVGTYIAAEHFDSVAMAG